MLVHMKGSGKLAGSIAPNTGTWVQSLVFNVAEDYIRDFCIQQK